MQVKTSVMAGEGPGGTNHSETAAGLVVRTAVRAGEGPTGTNHTHAPAKGFAVRSGVKAGIVNTNYTERPPWSCGPGSRPAMAPATPAPRTTATRPRWR